MTLSDSIVKKNLTCNVNKVTSEIETITCKVNDIIDNCDFKLEKAL